MSVLWWLPVLLLALLSQWLWLLVLLVVSVLLCVVIMLSLQVLLRVVPVFKCMVWGVGETVAVAAAEHGKDATDGVAVAAGLTSDELSHTRLQAAGYQSPATCGLRPAG